MKLVHNELLLNTVQELCYCTLLGGVQVSWMLVSEGKWFLGSVSVVSTADDGCSANWLGKSQLEIRIQQRRVVLESQRPFGRGYRQERCIRIGVRSSRCRFDATGWWFISGVVVIVGGTVSSTYRMDSTQRFRGMFNVDCVATAPVRKEQWYRMYITYFGVGPPSFWRGRMWGDKRDIT